MLQRWLVASGILYACCVVHPAYTINLVPIKPDTSHRITHGSLVSMWMEDEDTSDLLYDNARGKHYLRILESHSRSSLCGALATHQNSSVWQHFAFLITTLGCVPDTISDYAPSLWTARPIDVLDDILVLREKADDRRSVSRALTEDALERSLWDFAPIFSRGSVKEIRGSASSSSHISSASHSWPGRISQVLSSTTAELSVDQKAPQLILSCPQNRWMLLTNWLSFPRGLCNLRATLLPRLRADLAFDNLNHFRIGRTHNSVHCSPSETLNYLLMQCPYYSVPRQCMFFTPNHLAYLVVTSKRLIFIEIHCASHDYSQEAFHFRRCQHAVRLLVNLCVLDFERLGLLSLRDHFS